MAIDPNDLEAIKQSNKQALTKQRNRETERTPDANKYSKGKYPMRNVQEYVGGHRITVDSTPGYRIMERFHGSGTFEQWSEDGTETKVVVGNVQQHMKEGYSLTIDQNGDIRIEGHARVSIGGGAHVEIKGDATIYCQGDWTQYVNGNYNLTVTGHLSMSSSGNHNVATEGDRNVDIAGNDTNRVDGSKDTKISGSNKTETGGKTDEISGGNMTKKAPKIDLN